VELDDKLAEVVDKVVSEYEARQDRESISRTQLAALISHTESLGAEGLTKLIKQQRAKGARNERAAEQGKGKQRARNPVFWETLHHTVSGELGRLAADHGKADLVYSLFAVRLASELNYRTTLNRRRSR
jgi:hypothetical protein